MVFCCFDVGLILAWGSSQMGCFTQFVLPQVISSSPFSFCILDHSVQLFLFLVAFQTQMALVIKLFRDVSATELEKGDLFFPWSLFSLSIPGISDLPRSDLLPHSHFLLFTCAKSPRISKPPVSNRSLMVSAGLPCTTGWPGRIVTQRRKKWGLCPGKDDLVLSMEGYGRIMWGEGSSIDTHIPDHLLPLHIFAPHSVSESQAPSWTGWTWTCISTRFPRAFLSGFMFEKQGCKSQEPYSHCFQSSSLAKRKFIAITTA